MGNNSVPKFIFHFSRFPVYRGSVLGSFYCTITSQTSHTPPPVRSSYQLPFLLQLPWIALSQDSCQYRDQMTVWLTKLNFWQVHRFVSSESIQISGDLPSLTSCHPADTTHLLPWTKADRTWSWSLTYIQHQSQKSMELNISRTSPSAAPHFLKQIISPIPRLNMRDISTEFSSGGKMRCSTECNADFSEPQTTPFVLTTITRY